MYARRLAAAAAATADAGLAGLVITPGYDLRYLVGSRAQTFERLTALVLPASGDPTVVVPRLELASLKESAVAELGLAVRDWVDGDDPYQLVSDALGGVPAATAVTDSMPALHLLPLADVLGVLPVLATDVLRGLRMVKEECEIDALRKAGAAIDRVHARVPEFLRPGRTEADVAADIAEAIVAEGHSEVAFIIVGSGPHGADPHHGYSDRELQVGRHRRRRHRRRLRARIPLRLDPHLQHRRAQTRCGTAVFGTAAGPAGGRSTRFVPA